MANVRFKVLSLPAIAASLLIFLGCGGGGGGGSAAPFTGKKAARAVTVSGDQGQVAGGSYALPLLVATAPSGSPLSSFAKKFGIARTPVRGSALTFNSMLGLYYSQAIKGNAFVVSYFSDSAGKAPAGSLTATESGYTAFTTNFTTYPVTVALSINLPKGNLPCTGKGSISFSDATGANALQGDMTLPKSGAKLSMNMSLSTSGAVGGTVSVTQNGMTATVDQLTGDISDGFTGRATVTPQNYSGTATINLLAGTFALDLTLENGLTSQAAVDAEQALQINFNDGTQLSVSNTLTAPLTGPTTTTGGSTGGTVPKYNTATFLSPADANVTSISNNGQIIGYDYQNGTYPTYLYFSGPTSTGKLVGVGEYQYVNLYGLNNSGVIVGWGAKPNFEGYIPLYYSNPTAAPIALPLPDNYPADASGGWAVAINNKGQIVGFLDWGSKNGGVIATYWASPTTKPTKLKDASGKDASDLTGMQINDSGVIVGAHYYYSQQAKQAFVWPSPTSNAIPLIDGTGAAETGLCLLSANGTVAGTTPTPGASVPYIWTGPTYKPTKLKTPTGDSSASVLAIDSSGKMIGNTSSLSLAYWSSPTATPVDIASQFSNGYLYISGVLFLTDAGFIIGTSTELGQGYYVLAPK